MKQLKYKDFKVKMFTKAKQHHLFSAFLKPSLQAIGKKCKEIQHNPEI
jgi:hypothetical protein